VEDLFLLCNKNESSTEKGDKFHVKQEKMIMEITLIAEITLIMGTALITRSIRKMERHLKL
jgi:hypothetical protein